ncbi:hypothetical protein ABKN59_007688 [Abortiporus biennis]
MDVLSNLTQTHTPIYVPVKPYSVRRRKIFVPKAIATKISQEDIARCQVLTEGDVSYIPLTAIPLLHHSRNNESKHHGNSPYSATSLRPNTEHSHKRHHLSKADVSHLPIGNSSAEDFLSPGGFGPRVGSPSHAANVIRDCKQKLFRKVSKTLGRRDGQSPPPGSQTAFVRDERKSKATHLRPPPLHLDPSTSRSHLEVSSGPSYRLPHRGSRGNSSGQRSAVNNPQPTNQLSLVESEPPSSKKQADKVARRNVRCFGEEISTPDGVTEAFHIHVADVDQTITQNRRPSLTRSASLLEPRAHNSISSVLRRQKSLPPEAEPSEPLSPSLEESQLSFNDPWHIPGPEADTFTFTDNLSDALSSEEQGYSNSEYYNEQIYRENYFADDSSFSFQETSSFLTISPPTSPHPSRSDVGLSSSSPSPSSPSLGSRKSQPSSLHFPLPPPGLPPSPTAETPPTNSPRSPFLYRHHSRFPASQANTLSMYQEQPMGEGDDEDDMLSDSRAVCILTIDPDWDGSSVGEATFFFSPIGAGMQREEGEESSDEAEVEDEVEEMEERREREEEGDEQRDDEALMVEEDSKFIRRRTEDQTRIQRSLFDLAKSGLPTKPDEEEVPTQVEQEQEPSNGNGNVDEQYRDEDFYGESGFLDLEEQDGISGDENEEYQDEYEDGYPNNTTTTTTAAPTNTLTLKSNQCPQAWPPTPAHYDYINDYGDNNNNHRHQLTSQYYDSNHSSDDFEEQQVEEAQEIVALLSHSNSNHHQPHSRQPIQRPSPPPPPSPPHRRPQHISLKTLPSLPPPTPPPKFDISEPLTLGGVLAQAGPLYAYEEDNLENNDQDEEDEAFRREMRERYGVEFRL